jgi:hypothetical protein
VNYKSPISLFGLPLVHVAIGPPEGSPGVRGIAKGWIAVGDIAFGVVFALGGLAIGGLSVGGLSVGVLALAGLSIVNDHLNRAIPGSPYWSHPGIGLIEPRQDRPNRAT